MNKSYWIAWAKAAGLRAVKTWAQTFIATVGTSMVLTEVNWVFVISASVMAAILSIATSLTGLPEVTVPEYKDVE